LRLIKLCWLLLDHRWIPSPRDCVLGEWWIWLCYFACRQGTDSRRGSFLESQSRLDIADLKRELWREVEFRAKILIDEGANDMHHTASVQLCHVSRQGGRQGGIHGDLFRRHRGHGPPPNVRLIAANRAAVGMAASGRREMRANNRKQAELPRGAQALENTVGTAPGFLAVRDDGKFIACVPGVPHEMQPMVSDRLVPMLRERFDARGTIATRVLHTFGIAESEIDHRIEVLFRTSENPKIAVLAHDGRADVKIMAKAGSVDAAFALIEPVERDVRERLSGHVFGYDEQTLAGSALAILESRAQRLGVAESCTGGELAAAITAVPGSSKTFVGAVVAYENAVKSAILGVDAETIGAVGAVSEEVAAEMAAGARDRLGADIGISTTGVAGPSGGTPEKPVGLVWLGLASRHGVQTQRLQLRGDRASIQRRATTAALGFLWEYVCGREPSSAATRNHNETSVISTSGVDA